MLVRLIPGVLIAALMATSLTAGDAGPSVKPTHVAMHPPTAGHRGARKHHTKKHQHQKHHAKKTQHGSTKHAHRKAKPIQGDPSAI